MSGQSLVERLTKQFGDGISGTNFENIDPWIEVAADRIVEICTYLRDEKDLAFNFLNCVTGVDYFLADEKKAKKAGWEPHLEIVYHLYSMLHKHSIVLKVMLPRWKNDEEGMLPEIPTVSGVWPTADWHEREIFDLFGVTFLGHPDPRRILCPEDWVGHPLRKDYEMPKEYHGIRG